MIDSDVDDVAKVSSLGGSTLFLKNDGTVWYAGDNQFGQAGIGEASEFSTLAQVPGLVGIDDIAASFQSSYALRNDGTVWSWGGFRNGRLGYSASQNQLSPQQIPGLTGIEQIEAGASFVVARRNDGTVWTWGDNTYGQLGNGTNTDSSTPVQVTGLTNITAVEANFGSSYALNSSNQVYSWGNNTTGVLSDGVFPSVDQNTPVLSTFNNVEKFGNLAGHQWVVVVVDTNGDVFYSGLPSSGFSTGIGNGCEASGSGSVSNCATTLTNVEEIASDGNTLIYRDTSGVTRANGSGVSGAKSDGTFPNVFTNEDLTSQITGVPINLVAGGSGRFFAVQPDGDVKVWGINSKTELGISTASRVVDSELPESIVQAGNWDQVDRGTVALDSNGDVFIWGFNLFGLSGDGNPVNDFILSPQQVPSLSNITDIYSTGGFHYAKNNTGDVYVWGRNNANQLGIGGITSDPGQTTPVINTDLANFQMIHPEGSCGIDANDDLYCWGWNINGQTGTGTVGGSIPTPTLIDNNVVDVSSGARNAIYAKSDGTVWVMGGDLDGCLGNGASTADEPTPIQVVGLTNIINVERCTALDSSGNVYRWGLTSFIGPIGDGTDQDQLTPVQITTPEPIQDISNTRLVGNSGTLYNYSGPESLVPVAVSNVTNVTDLSNGNLFQGDIDNPIETTDIPSLNLSCDEAVAESTTTCTFNQPTDTFTPADFKLAVGNANPAGNCSESNGTVTCITVPVGTFQGSGDSEQQDIFAQIASDAITDTGEDATVHSRSADTDGDGIPNDREQDTTGTDPFDSDSDSDGLPDGWEDDNGLDPNDDTGDNGFNGDPDGDGLVNGNEYQLQHNPQDSDSDSGFTTGVDENDNSTNDCDEDLDGDNVSNCDEILNGLDPLTPNTDTDGDGIPDDYEVDNNLDPNDPNDRDLDPDSDGLTNYEEFIVGTDSNDPDSDSFRTPSIDENDNGIGDAEEDFDSDGLTNREELNNNTNPLNPDSDGDGLPDGWEVDNGFDPLVDDRNGDPDGDGLRNEWEFRLGFMPTNADSDSSQQQLTKLETESTTVMRI